MSYFDGGGGGSSRSPDAVGRLQASQASGIAVHSHRDAVLAFARPLDYLGALPDSSGHLGIWASGLAFSMGRVGGVY